MAIPSFPADPSTMFVSNERNFLWLQFFGPHSAPDSSAINLQIAQKFRGWPWYKKHCPNRDGDGLTDSWALSENLPMR